MLEKLGRFVDWLWSFPNKLLEWLQDAYDSFIDFLENFPQWVFSGICEAVVKFFEAIPVPQFFHDAGSAMQSIPPQVIFFTSMFRLDFGVTVVLLAYLIRFVIRRIPIIG